MRYASKEETINHDILPALGEYAEDHDIDAIFAQAYTWENVYRVDGSIDPSSGFTITVNADEFWDIVQRSPRN